MTTINLFNPNSIIPLQTKEESSSTATVKAENRLATPENWYAEPFTKRTACNTPGQCGGDCDCGCPYNTMTELERLPLIEDIASIFPNEWLAFIISAQEDDDFEPMHGKLVAHSPNPDEVYDALNAVLWNQHIYVYFNGDYEGMKASYGDSWEQTTPQPEQRSYSGPKQIIEAAESQTQPPPPLPDDLLDLIYSAIDQLYGQPRLNEAIRRLRLARVRATNTAEATLLPLLDSALDQLESPLPRINETIWFLEESLTEVDNEQ